MSKETIKPKKFTKRSKRKLLYIGGFVICIAIVFSVAAVFDYKESSDLEAISNNNDFTVNEISDEKVPEEIEPEENTETEEEDENEPAETTEEEPQIMPPEPAPTPQSNWWDYPDNIQMTPKSGDDLSVIVNKAYQLPATYIPSDLVTLTAANSGCRITKTLQVRSIILDDLKQLCDAATADGVDLSIISAYRSYTTQQSTYQYWVNYNGGDIDVADQVSARPGHSEHQLGTTVDFSTNEIGDAIGSQFNSTTAANWLESNASGYSFSMSYPEGMEEETGYAYEGWHFRYVGR